MLQRDSIRNVLFALRLTTLTAGCARRFLTPTIGQGGRGAIIILVLAAMLGDRALAVWQTGDFEAYPQDSWGATPTATNIAGLLVTNYGDVYAATSGVLEIGIPGPAGFSMLFTNGVNVNEYLPGAGVMGPLTIDLLNPTVTMTGTFGGELTGLQLNVDFSDANLLQRGLGLPFGDLVLHNMESFSGQMVALNGLSLRTLLAELEVKIGGGSPSFSYGIVELANVVNYLNSTFAGSPNSFAQDHLRLPHFVTGDFTTHTQASWGEAPSGSNAAALLANNYAAVYAGTGSVFEVGNPGFLGSSMQFTGAGPLLAYLPGRGPDGPLGADYVNPLSTLAGGFGGEMAALKLNIDFADEGCWAASASPSAISNSTTSRPSSRGATTTTSTALRSGISIASRAAGWDSTAMWASFRISTCWPSSSTRRLPRGMFRSGRSTTCKS
jgi:hypothetical protein